MERFFGLLIEHHSGAFPVWLAPVQAAVLPISERHQEYAEKTLASLLASGVRAELDSSNNTLNYRIRSAQTQQVPFMLVVGDKEQSAGAVAVRVRNGEDLGAIPLEQFISLIKEKIANKVIL
jgi:threonyl-tRNA synthetase